MDWVAECASNALDAQVPSLPSNTENIREKHAALRKKLPPNMIQLKNSRNSLILSSKQKKTTKLSSLQRYRFAQINVNSQFNMLLNEKKAKIRELTNNGPVPEAIIPEEPDSPDEADEPAPKRGKKAVKASHTQSEEPTRGKRGAVTTKVKTTEKGKAAAKKPTPAAKGKRKRTPTPEPEVQSDDEPMQDGSATEDEEDSVQGDDERDADVERVFGGRKDDEGDVTEDEEL
jgi:hypothetical protein